MAATDYFLKIEGIDGESTDERHADWIEVLSFSWGVSQPRARSGMGAAGGRAAFQDFSVVKTLDKSSPTLMNACASGRHIKFLQLSLARTDQPADYFTLKFEDCIVSSQKLNGTDEANEFAEVVSNSLPLEQVGFTYGKIEMAYRQTREDGTLDDAVHESWDLRTNQAF